MFTYAIFIALSVISTFAQPHIDLQKSQLIDAAHDYVRLHLIKDLSNAPSISAKVEGRNWLRDWDNKRLSILKIVMSKNVGTAFESWHTNWRERLQMFQELQHEYLQEIVDKYYDHRRVPSSWPTIIHDPITFNTYLDPNSELVGPNERDAANPLATDNDIDRVMSFHRPLSYNTPSEADKKKPGTNVNEKKKYYIISLERMSKVVETRYELMRESLKGKRISDLDYRAAIFQGERVIATLSVWYKRGLTRKFDQKDYHLNLLVPMNLWILNDDHIYRQFLNLDDKFFSGNSFFGYENRYDDPLKHGLGFDVNAKHLISQKRYELMYELYQKINDFSLASDNFKLCKLSDLLLIDMFLEHYKTLTYWFRSAQFKKSNWFFTNVPDSRVALPMVRPHFQLGKGGMFKKVELALESAKKSPIRKNSMKSMMKIGSQLTHDIHDEIKSIRNKRNDLKGIAITRFINFAKILSYTNLLPYITSTIPLQLPPQQLLSSQIHFLLRTENPSLYDSENKLKMHRDNQNVEHVIEDDLDSIQDLFDPRSDDSLPLSMYLTDGDFNGDIDIDQFNEDSDEKNLKKRKHEETEFNRIETKIKDVFDPSVNTLIQNENYMHSMSVYEASSSNYQNYLHHTYGTGGDEYHHYKNTNLNNHASIEGGSSPKRPRH